MAEAVGKNAISGVHDAEGSGPLGCVHLAMLSVMGDRFLGETDECPQVERVRFMREEAVGCPDLGWEIWLLHRKSSLEEGTYLLQCPPVVSMPRRGAYPGQPWCYPSA